MTVQRPPRPILHFIRPFTVRVINPLTRRFAGRLPGFGIISYRGRTSGKTYHTPMNVIRDGDDYVFALTYGSDVQWAKNVLANGRAELRTRDITVPLTDPVLFVDPARRLMPRPVRLFLGFQGVTEFLRMRPLASGTPPGDLTTDARLEAR
jgi:deazaflavin-dependent oxidoreductase (nitroreductase family)